jgi:hypothetical protein
MYASPKPCRTNPNAPATVDIEMGYFFSLSKSTTVICLDLSEWALLVFGALLVVGLVIEYRAAHGSRLMKIGEMLVIIGVLGELLGDGGIFVFSNQLQTINESEISGVKNVTAELNKAANDAKLEQEKLRASNLELEKILQPRRLSTEQQKQIAASLKPYAGKTVSVASYSRDAEAMVLGIQIEDALSSAKILVWNRLGTFSPVGMPLYTGVVVDKNSANKKLALALFEALKTKGGLVPLKDSVAFGQGSTMFLPTHPAGSTAEDSFVFVGEKPIADIALPAREVQQRNISAK